MTCINQYMKEHPDATLSEVIKNYCPCEFYNIDEFEGCTDETWGDCKSCWNREIPEDKKEKRMTYKEKYIIEHPEHRDNMNAIMNTSCPDSWDNPKNPYCGPERIKNDCIACWNRELTENELNKFNKEREKMCECNDKRELLDMIKDYENRLAKANEEIDNFEGRAARYVSEILRLTAELNDSRNELAEFKKEYEILDKESDRQDNMINNQRNIIEGCKETMNNLNNQIQNLLETNEKMQKTIKCHEAEIDKLHIEVDNLTDRVEDQKETITKYQKMRRCIEDLGCTVTADFVVVPPVKHIISTELELMDLKGRYEALSSSYNSKKKALDTQNEEIDSLHDKVKLRDEEIDKLVKENEELRVDMQRRDDTITGLCARLNEHDDLINAIAEKNEEIDKLVAENNKLNERITAGKVRNDNLDTNLLVIREENKNLKDKIDFLTMQIKDYEDCIDKHEATIEGKNQRISELCTRIDKLDKARYIEQDITMTKELYELFSQARPIVIPKEEPTIRPFSELPYVRYARHIHMKYKALTDSGFSHDDAMGLIPMWDDNEFEGFKHRERDE